MKCTRPSALENSKYVHRNEAFEQLNTQQFGVMEWHQDAKLNAL